MAQGILERISLGPEQMVFREGDEGDRAYIVQEGLVEIFKNVGDEEVVLGTVEKGGIFGEMALIDDQPRMASARAATATTVIVIARQNFQSKLAKCDPFIRGLLGIFVKNIRSITEDRHGG